MSLPEAHLDTVYVPGSIDAQVPRVPTRRVLGAMMMPLLFVVSFVLCYVSALHSPVPHDLALTVTGPNAATSSVASAINDRAPSAFDLTRTTDPAAAAQAVRTRESVGAIVLGSTGSGSKARTTVTTLVASGGGRIAASAVESVGAQVAAQADTTATVRDLAPLPSEDPNGVGLFYLIIIASIGGYLTITVLAQAIPRAGLRTKLITAAAAAVLTPIVALAALSFSVGIFGMDFGQLAAVAGVVALYVLVTALLALFFNELLGQASILGILVVALALNFPSTGGSVPESMLPGFWQAIHATWFGSGALETVRSLIFFGGDGFGWPFTRLLIWLVAAAAAFLGADAAKARRASRVAERPANMPEHADTAPLA